MRELEGIFLIFILKLLNMSKKLLNDDTLADRTEWDKD